VTNLHFAWPFMLAGLVVLPIIVALDLLARRRRARYAIAFSNVGVLRSVAPKVPSWRRYVPLAFLLAALAAMIVGLARPQRSVAVARKQATVIMDMDTSGSMIAKDVAPTRLGAATSAAASFVNSLPSTFKVSLVPFQSTATVAVAPTYDHSAVTKALRRLRANGGTAIGDAISLSLAVARPGRTNSTGPLPISADGHGRVILLLSDGSNTSGMPVDEAIAQARSEHVRVYTVAFGTPGGVISAGNFGQIVAVPPDPSALKQIANETGGEFYSVADEDTLKQVYKHIGSQVGTTTQRQDIGYGFAAGGAVLLLFAGSLAMLWRNPVV
jgi:Ca-activated chloride channel family protein